MKKFLLIAAAILGIAAAAQARDTYSHDPSVLPEAAATTIKNNFKSSVSVIKIDKDFGHVSDYEVVLTDGTEIKFDSKGNWEDIETSVKDKVPATFIPKAAAEYISKSQPGTHVVGIERERNGYEITLSNGVELKFDKTGSFLKYD